MAVESLLPSSYSSSGKPASLRGRLSALAPVGSLARHLVRRLLPTLVALIVLDLGVTWVVTRKVGLEAWVLRDIFWTMMISQALLVSLFAWVLVRSEEHTPELQSLMRISYAVFCLKKKNTKNKITTTISNIR